MNFYPRSPCGERQFQTSKLCNLLIFLSTLSLRRATFNGPLILRLKELFLSTLSLRRATIAGRITSKGTKISIHALLAESDHNPRSRKQPRPNFYPRSPCGERRRPKRLKSRL